MGRGVFINRRQWLLIQTSCVRNASETNSRSAGVPLQHRWLQLPRVVLPLLLLPILLDAIAMVSLLRLERVPAATASACRCPCHPVLRCYLLLPLMPELLAWPLAIIVTAVAGAVSSHSAAWLSCTGLPLSFDETRKVSRSCCKKQKTCGNTSQKGCIVLTSPSAQVIEGASFARS